MVSAPRKLLPSYLVLIGGVLIVSSAAILIKIAQSAGVSSLSIGALRLTIAALILTPIAVLNRGKELRSLTRRDGILCLLAGFFLAAHFASWFTSLIYTSVASSVALVTTNPIWIALISIWLFKEKLTALLWAGIAFAIVGGGFIFWSDSVGTTGSNPLLGNVLAVIGSLTVCGYLLLGRKLRQQLSLLTYIWLVYSSGAIFMLLAALLSGAELSGFTTLAWLAIIGLALGPQLLGHTAFNWALSHLSPAFIAVVVLGEPIGSALLAWLIFQEGFASWQLAGFAFLLFGIYLAGRAEHERLSASN